MIAAYLDLVERDCMHRALDRSDKQRTRVARHDQPQRRPSHHHGGHDRASPASTASRSPTAVTVKKLPSSPPISRTKACFVSSLPAKAPRATPSTGSSSTSRRASTGSTSSTATISNDPRPTLTSTPSSSVSGTSPTPTRLVYCGFGLNSGQINPGLERIGWDPPKVMNAAIMWAFMSPAWTAALDGWTGIEQTLAITRICRRTSTGTRSSTGTRTGSGTAAMAR